MFDKRIIDDIVPALTKKYMARTKNPENVYEVTCAVTGTKYKTSPIQFAHLMGKLGITKDELLNSYVSQKGRQILAAECKNNPDAAIEKYKLHPVVAHSLRATRKKVQATLIPMNVSVDISEKEDTPMDATTVPEKEIEKVGT